MVSFTHNRIFWALPDTCCKDALYKSDTVWRAAQLLLPCRSAGCSPALVSLYSVHIQLFQLNRGWSMFPSPSCSELQGGFLAHKAPYPLPITQQSPDIPVGTKNKGIFLDSIFSEVWSKRHWDWGTKCLLLNSPICSPISQGTATLRRWKKLIQEAR